MLRAASPLLLLNRTQVKSSALDMQMDRFMCMIDDSGLEATYVPVRAISPGFGMSIGRSMVAER